MPKVPPAPLARPLYEIAREIREDYRAQGKPVYYAAKPYVDGMAQLSGLEDRYYEDPAPEVVRYAISNLGAWRGVAAPRVKQELKAALNAYDIARGKKPSY